MPGDEMTDAGYTESESHEVKAKVAHYEKVRENPEAMAETIENNVRKLIIDETPANPKYYEKMSELLDALIRR